ncbi:MAG: 2Fe-2S iron-sulfur cluster-binding protein [Candidatus Zhuqueibacterota bacterium]
MINLTMNGLDVQVEEGTTLLEAANLYGFHIPTLCYHDGLSPYGACRLCVVEIASGASTKIVSSCTYPATEGLKVFTNSQRVLDARKMVIELHLATCPGSKVIQDLASKHGVHQVRFKQEYEDCINCGLCVRMCAEQMMGKAIGFVGRGHNRHITTPFDIRSEECRLCGGCMYICPACQMRCIGPNFQSDGAICNACSNLEPPCVEYFDNMMCYMDPCVACEQASGRIPKHSR